MQFEEKIKYHIDKSEYDIDSHIYFYLLMKGCALCRKESIIYLQGLFFWPVCCPSFRPVYFPFFRFTWESWRRIPGRGRFFFGLKVYASPLVKTVFFITGLSTVFFSLGFGTGFFSHIFYHPYTPYVMGGIVILLGLHQMELININFLQRQKKIELDGKRQGGILGAFLLGLTFSFGWTPCVGPVLGAVLAVVASENGSALYGGLLMAVYAAGMAVPFLILAVASSWLLKYSSHVKRHMVLLKKRLAAC